MQLPNKVVSLDLAPFSEKVENHWFMLCRSSRHALIARLGVGIAGHCGVSQAVSKALRKYNLAVTLVLEIIRNYYPKDIFSLVARSLSVLY